MATKVEKVRSIINVEEQRARDAITERCTPIVQAEFDRLQRKFPRLRLVKIVFGMGTWVYDFDDGLDDFDPRRRHRDSVPRDFEVLTALCDELQDYLDDIT